VLAGNKTIVNKRLFFRKVSKELKKLKLFPEFSRPPEMPMFHAFDRQSFFNGA
jgi:hypothetical protein